MLLRFAEMRNPRKFPDLLASLPRLGVHTIHIATEIEKLLLRNFLVFPCRCVYECKVNNAIRDFGISASIFYESQFLGGRSMRG